MGGIQLAHKARSMSEGTLRYTAGRFDWLLEKTKGGMAGNSLSSRERDVFIILLEKLLDPVSPLNGVYIGIFE